MARQGQEIANPRTGQTMRFIETAGSTGGALLRIETVNPPTGRPEPEHVHPEQESSAEVLEGDLRFRVDGVEHVVRAGEKLVIPANTPHTFWNDGTAPARAIQEFRPALRIEDFFETYFALAQAGALNAEGMPSLLQTAVLLPAYAREMRPTSPPWPLIWLLGAVLGPIARARGVTATRQFA
jgi:quercetin dioxygenase-like cupin family protein